MKRSQSDPSISQQQWLNELLSLHPKLKPDSLQAAVTLATERCQEQTLLHKGMIMADHLLNLGVNETLLAAAILYPLLTSKHITLEAIEKHINKHTAELLKRCAQLEDLQKITQSSQSNTGQLRKMIMAMVDDIQIVLIKLVEQIASLELLRKAPKEQQVIAAKPVSELYAPLANRLGIGQLKWLLEDWAFRYSHPDDYSKISKSLNMRREDRENFVAQMVQQLTELVQQTHIKDAKVYGRAKHIYSIYRKLNRKNVAFDEIYDASAMRIIVPNIEDCYAILGIVHATWPHIKKEFDDYIANPKPNGYRSIHTAVIGPGNHNVEIQIRTHAMHEEAELGVAAHWAYKEGKPQADEKTHMLQQMMSWQEEVTQSDNSEALFEDRIYVFTPQGDIIDLAAGATPLDFAYHVHTSVGHRCKGALVNGKLVPLTHKLHSGDQVRIQTQKEEHPSRDWINADNGYLSTQRAREKVAQWFRKENYHQNVVAGLTIWEKASRHKHISKVQLQQAVAHFNYKRFDDILAALGANDLGITTLLNFLEPKETSSSEPNFKKVAPAKTRGGITIDGVDDLLTQLAKCCKPVPGDEIVGYISSGRGIIIHKKDCSNIQHMSEKNQQRILAVSWPHNSEQRFPIDVVVIAHNRTHLLHDVSSCISASQLPIEQVQSFNNRKTQVATIQITVDIKNLDEYASLAAALKKINGVKQVTRKGSQ